MALEQGEGGEFSCRQSRCSKAVTANATEPSNLTGASGSATGSGSSVASKLSWSVGALSAIAFLVLCVSALRARHTARH